MNIITNKEAIIINIMINFFYGDFSGTFIIVSKTSLNFSTSEAFVKLNSFFN